jgi:glutaredoxin
MKKVEVTLYSRPGCHLCEAAMSHLVEISKKLTPAIELEITEISITNDPVLEKKFSDYVPVIHINNEPHDFYAVNEERFIKAVQELTQ